MWMSEARSLTACCSSELTSLMMGASSAESRRSFGSWEISVASAVCLYEAFRQRLVTGAYDEPSFSPEVLATMEQDWLKR